MTGSLAQRNRLADRYILSTFPVLWVPMTEGHRSDGATFLSSDGIGHTCTVTGALWTLRGRKYSNAGDKIVIPHNAAFNFGTGEFTLIAYVKPTEIETTHHTLFSKIDPEAATEWAWQITLNTGVLVLRSGAANLISSTGALSINNWYQVALARRGGTIYQYINGVEDATTAVDATNLSNAVDLNIGYRNAGYPGVFAGTYGEGLIYNRGLTAGEISNNYVVTRRY